MGSLQDAIANISSEKATERAAGLEQYREIFENRNNIDRLGKGEEGDKKWLRVVQGLFNCVVTERSVCVRKGAYETAAPASKKRLQDCASMVLWLIERVGEHLGCKSLVSSVNHITNMLIFRAQLFEPIASIYFKALHSLLSFKPHLHHLDADLWSHCLNMSFNTILGAGIGDECNLSDARQEAHEFGSQKSSTSPRRTRPEDVEASRCVLALVSSDYAPILGPKETGSMALMRISSILAVFPLETSLHLPVVEAARILSDTMVLNRPESAKVFAELSWHRLNSLWSTRGNALKEQVQLLQRSLTPLLIKAEQISLLQDLYDQIRAEGEERISSNPLKIESLEIRCNAKMLPFQSAFIRLGITADEGDLRAWSMLEHAADLAVAIFNSHRKEDDDGEVTARSKRRKGQNGSAITASNSDLPQLCDSVSAANKSFSHRLWSLQIILFITIRGFPRLRLPEQNAIIQLALGKGENHPALQQWCFLILTECSLHESCKKHAANAWNAASRQAASSSNTSRAAYALLSTIVRHRLLSRAELCASIEAFMDNLKGRGTFPLCDSLAWLLVEIMRYSKQNVQLSQHGHEHDVLRSMANWSANDPYTVSSAQGLLRSEDVANVLLTACDCRQRVINPPPVRLPKTTTSDWLGRNFDEGAIKQYVLSAELSIDAVGRDTSRDAAEVTQLAPGQAKLRLPTLLEQRSVTLMSDAVESAQLKLKRSDPDEKISEAMLRSMIHIGLAAIYLHAVLHDIGVSLDQIAVSTCFSFLAACIDATEWSMLAIPSIRGIIELLATSFYSTATLQKRSWDLRTGYDRAAEPELTTLSQSHSLLALWNDDAAEPIVQALQKMFNRFRGDGRIAQGQEEDVSWVESGAVSHQEDKLALLTSSLSILGPVIAASISSSQNFETPIKVLATSIAQESTAAFIKLAECIMQRTPFEFLTIDGDVQEIWTDRIGSDILATYEFERSIQGHLVALAFLRCASQAREWNLSGSDELSERLLQLCDFFVQQHMIGNLHWKASIALTDYMLDLLGKGPNLPASMKQKTVIKSILQLCKGPDVRAQFHAAAIMRHLFINCTAISVAPIETYIQLQDYLPKKANDRSEMAMRILTLGNVCAAHSWVRSRAFFHIVETCMIEPSTTACGISVVTAVARCLEMGSPRTLWQHFSPDTVRALIMNDQDLGNVPVTLLGYANQKDWARATLDECAPILLSEGVDAHLSAFQLLCDLGGRSFRLIVWQCLPAIVAYMLVGNLSTRKTYDKLFALVSSDMSKSEVTQAIDVRLDEVIVNILQHWHEDDMKEVQNYIVERTKLADWDHKFVDFDFDVAERSSRGTKAICMVIDDVLGMHSKANRTALIFNVVHQIGKIVISNTTGISLHTLSFALQVFCAHQWTHIERSAILQRLALQVMASLDGLEGDGRRVLSSSPLLVALLRLPCPTGAGYMPLLVDLAGRIAAREVQEVRQRLLTLIMDVAVKALDDNELRSDAIAALCAWPSPLPSSVVEVLGQFDIEDLNRSLQFIGQINHFFLKRCRRFVMDASGETIRAFCSSTLWSIIDVCNKSSANTAADLTKISVLITDIFYYCSGQLETPRVRALQEPRDKTHLINAVREIAASTKTPTLPLRTWIVGQLLQSTRSKDLIEAQDAVRAIRLMHAHDPSFSGKLDSFKSEFDLITAADLEAETTSTRTFREELMEKQSRKVICDHDAWAVWLCVLLCGILTTRDPGRPYMHLAGFVGQRPMAAATQLPAIVHILFRSGLGKDVEAAKDVAILSEHFLSALKDDNADPRVWKTIIEIVLQLRHDVQSDEAFASERWIRGLDFLLLARRATSVHLYASALLFVELRQHQNEPLSDGQRRLEKDLLYTVYEAIGDPDSFYGVTNDDVNDALMRTLQHEHRWRELFELAAARHESVKDRRPSKAITEALHRQGFDKLALQVDVMAEPDYEAAWRARKWDLPTNESGDQVSSQDLYMALRSLHEDLDPTIAEMTLRRSYLRGMEGLKGVNVEASRNAADAVKNLLCLREVRQWNDGRFEMYVHGAGFRFDFELYERLQNVQLSLLQANHSRMKRLQDMSLNIEELEASSSREALVLFELGRRALEEGENRVAANAIVQAQHLMSAVDATARQQLVDEEFANVLWAQGHHAMALSSLESTLNTIEVSKGSEAAKRRRGVALSRLGQWRATARSHQAHSIMSDCYEPAVKLLTSCKATSDLASTLYRYGVFADEQYRQRNSSTEAKELRLAVKLRQEEIRLLGEEIERPTQASTRDGKRGVSHAMSKAQQIQDLDLAALKEHDDAARSSRRIAAECFLRHLSMSEEQNSDSLMRLTALWFESAQLESFNKQVLAMSKQVPSWKFLPLARQLCSRITRECPGYEDGSQQSVKQSSQDFQRSVFDLVHRMAADHPFHALTPLYALARVDSDSDKPKLRALEVRSSSQSALQRARSETAQEIIDMATSTSRQRDRISHLLSVCHACVEWAQFDLEAAKPKETVLKSGSVTRIPLHLKLVKLRNVDVPVLTANLPVDPTGAYKSFTSIARYADHFTTAGGVHLPKISNCIGSDGKVYRQLFKDRDDLRQDAVMQQVFALVNELLGNDRRARRRHLYVRTYCVVPLGPRYGLLEFVGNTTPVLNAVMTAYDKHGGGKMTPKQARVRISELHGQTAEEKRKGFLDVCKAMPPAFRFYFLDRYTVPMALLQARLNYTRSVATSSIVGHMLGLGDRHCSNILLDQRTGEVIHIDFGVAFDQGRLLPIPELVPFRLTRNVVDGMGLNGVEGVFRCGCQETLRILRSSASMIKTVLEVFRYDPLYDWTLNPIKQIQAQGFDDAEAGNEVFRVSSRLSGGGGGGGRKTLSTRTSTVGLKASKQGNDVAELQAIRAINSVMDKLSDRLSVEYTVNDLMTKAMDATNLASIYHGWQAAL